jgi:hypothetical protein
MIWDFGSFSLGGVELMKGGVEWKKGGVEWRKGELCNC